MGGGGRVPSELAMVENLERLDLCKILLGVWRFSKGRRLPSLTSCVCAFHIVAGNNLEGTIPSHLGSLTAMTWLDLGM
jgi:hypothetical protein